MFDSLINTLLVIVGLYVYLSLLRQVAVRPNGAGSLGEKQLGLPEAIAAALLVAWFGLNVVAALKTHQVAFRTGDLLLTGGFSLAVVAVLSALLQLRGFSVLSLGGFSRLGFGRIVSTAAVLLFAAYPLLFAADAISRWVLGEGSSRQQIVEMFTSSQTLGQRVLIIVLAIVIAPFAEEFIFRFFLYGVLKRYFGRGIGLILNALLFGAVHVHLPSLGPLFVLGSCFTLAYEWTGSILVSMTMHALFNFISLSALAFPDLLPQ
ncbi:MAG TPA: type II CAAX endopeptidase family protein [Chthoniobacterales bacterium]|jgi:membrane protease YdiL (CAAX protease family)|nr:type II CAAX endopeptidase family protein [Chthoniobacterales bacterium]